MQTALIRGISGTFAIKVFNAGILFIIGVVLARLLGTAQYGIYAYSLTIITFVALPLSKGWPQLLVRQVAKYKSLAQWAFLRGLLRWIRLFGFLFSLMLIIIGLSLLFIGQTQQWLDNTFACTLSIAMLLIGCMPFVQMNEAVIRGLGHPIPGVIMSQAVRPLLFLLLIAISSWSLSNRFQATHGMTLQVCAHAGTLLLSALLLSKFIPEEVKASLPAYEPGPWIKSGIPLMGVGGMQVINSRIDLLLLGALEGPTDAGIYHAVIRCAELVIFGMAVINVTFAPIVARLYTQNAMQELQKSVLQCTVGMLLFAFPVACLLIFFRHQVLSLFGPGFVEGSTALIVLSLGQMLIAGIGPVGIILNMTGHERVTALWVGISACCNIILNIVLIPFFGLVGPSVATTFSLLLRNVVLSRKIKQKISLRTTLIRI